MSRESMVVRRGDHSRNTQVVRQWQILRALDTAHGTTVGLLVAEHHVTKRTIRRDLDALQQAGFPIYDDNEHVRLLGKEVARFLEALNNHGLNPVAASVLLGIYREARRCEEAGR
jgi:predicted DNA-binding transcriptional regulator YafY